MDEAVALLVSQDKNPAFHKVVSGLKAVHPPRNVGGLRIQPINLLKAKQEAAPVQQVAMHLTVTKATAPSVTEALKPLPLIILKSKGHYSDLLSFAIFVKQVNLLNRMPGSAPA